MNAIQDSSLHTPQGSDGGTAGSNSDHDSSLHTQGSDGDTAGSNSDHDSSLHTQGSDGETAGSNSGHDSSPEASQGSHTAQGDGEIIDSSPQKSSLELPEENALTQGNGDTADISSYSSQQEAHEGSTLSEGDGETADVNPPQESSLESPQASSPAKGDGDTAGSLSQAPYIPTDTDQFVSASDENKALLPEAEKVPEDRQHAGQELSPVELIVSNGSHGNHSDLTPLLHASMEEGKTLPDSTHTHHTEHSMEQASAIISQSVQETDTSSNTETNNQTSDITTGVYSYPDKPNSVTSYVHTSTAAEVSPSPDKSSIAWCPFSEQHLHINDDYDSPNEIHSESTKNKNSHSEPQATSISRVDTHQTSSDAENARPANRTPEDTPLVSSRFSGQSIPTRRGIRNLFPQVSVDLTSESSERSSLEIDAYEESNITDNHTEEAVEGDIVLVTGGSGFLGQHIVKLLNLRAPHVGEIRVLDLVPFQKKLDYPTTKRVKSLVGDISNSDCVHKALKGVNSVIHVAGLVSWGTFPDHDGMERVNVKGTVNVLNACLENNVQRLVYCSTVDVAVGNKPIRGGTEEDTPVPDKFLFPGYPETKFHGERIILGSGQLKRRDGEHLQTVILRPNVLYGELDKYYVTNALRMAKQSMGILYKIGNGKAMFQQAYVGNAAWAFVCADAAMKANPALTREVFYIPDNTPVQNSFNFMIPYLQVHGLQLSNGYLSYALSHSAVAVAELLAKVFSPLMKLNLPVQSCTIAYINTDLYFRGEKAQRILNYYPIYTPSDARELSMKYYANLDLDERSARGNNPEQR